ncbi:MAG TPA: DUF4124 domain-containing protein [Gallionella sp.]|nr:DUF4124 domain-containing protein [Gallionella sp.]
MKKYLFAILILSAANTDAGINKWVDEHGKVHYSDQPPVGVEATKLRAASPPASAPAPAKSIAEREAELKKARQSQTEAAERAALQQSNAETEKANCNAAQQALRSLQQGGRIVEFDESGERRYVEDSDRQQRITKAQAEASQWCK